MSVAYTTVQCTSHVIRPPYAGNCDVYQLNECIGKPAFSKDSNKMDI